MAEEETKNNEKDLVESTPEQLKELEQDKEVLEEFKKLEAKEESQSEEKIRQLEKKDRLAKEQTERLDSWIPKTELGKQVKAGNVKSIDDILQNGKKILEPEIVDLLLPVESDLILIGQAKGKFGGGKRRAWRQTQKKTKEGNILTFSSMAIVGDKKSHIGIGYGKAKETLPAREKALRQAKLNLIKIKLGFETPEEGSNDPHTIPFKVEGKCGSVKMVLFPAPRGTGLVAGDECKKILKLAGIKDVYSQTFGKTKTTFNLAKACVDALSKTVKME